VQSCNLKHAACIAIFICFACHSAKVLNWLVACIIKLLFMCFIACVSQCLCEFMVGINRNIKSGVQYGELMGRLGSAVRISASFHIYALRMCHTRTSLCQTYSLLFFFSRHVTAKPRPRGYTDAAATAPRPSPKNMLHNRIEPRTTLPTVCSGPWGVEAIVL